MSAPDTATVGEQDLFNATSDDKSGLCFIETQFPVSKLSKESYTERKAVAGQTLTGLGKWWGRKPLVLVRATILGLLLPATDDPETDREVFLRLMTMDEDGHLRRKNTSIPQKVLFERLPPSDREKYFKPGSTEKKATYKKGLSREVKEELQRRVFLSMSYDERLGYCARSEQIDGPSPESWDVINQHLGTSAATLQELVEELGKRRFGHIPRVGDSFCGGGSIPFEAARLGCEAYGSDLNPVAALLTWAALNIVGGGEEVVERVQEAQREVYDKVDRQITEWGIEHREPDPETGRRWRADAYLYCIEATCPECGWRVPMAPSWVIAEKTNVIAELVPDEANKRFDFNVREGVSKAEMKAASNGTAQNSELHCPNPACEKSTRITAIRGDGRGSNSRAKNLLRPWENADVVPRPDDIFGERLYCVRWVDTWTEIDERGREREVSERHYLAPTQADLDREARVLELLMERFDEWQQDGFIPSRRIEPGAKTTEPIRTRGWTHWHHLFTPRQLLTHGLYNSDGSAFEGPEAAGILLTVMRLANWDSRLCRWQTSQSGGAGGGKDTFTNQALNTLCNYTSRGVTGLSSILVSLPGFEVRRGHVLACDARTNNAYCDVWLTDPPYADAIKYEEISEHFLVWLERRIPKHFPDWYADSKRALAVRGEAAAFSTSMIDCYQRMSQHMPDNGWQVVMFTHQDAGVWADLSMILWAAGLRVTAAWCIATETGPATGEGNYVQGTVLLILRKRTSDEVAFLDEIHHEVESEVRRQLSSMQALDDRESPNFADSDYQLAAYAAALRVLTSKQIEDIDVERELTRERQAGEVSPVEKLIEEAVKIAADHLVPRGLESHLWKSMAAPERFYLKGVEVESHGEAREGVYQEFARGFGFEGYRSLMASTAANQARLKTASELGKRDVGGDPGSGFGGSLVRHALFATWKTAQNESTQDGLNWLKTEMPDYSQSRRRLIDILNFLATFRQNASMEHWHDDADAARLLAGALENDHV